MSHPEETAVMHITKCLHREFGDAPATLVVLGSGLGAAIQYVEVIHRVSTRSVGLPQSTVEGHAGEMIRGRINGADIMFMSGRIHLYEGHPPAVLVRYVRAAHRWGIKRLLLTCSAGGITEGLNPGCLVLISDHINFMGTSPLQGEAWTSNRFPDMTSTYSVDLRSTFQAIAKREGHSLDEGVYAAMMGPAYETPAEIRMLACVGADMVGMSTVPEALAAAEVGLEVGAIAAISNRAAGLADHPLSHDDVQVVAERAARQFYQLLSGASDVLSQ